MSSHEKHNSTGMFHGLLTDGVKRFGHLAADNHILLGKNPNSIPSAEPKTDGPSREVRIGFHPVGGALGIAVTHAINLHPFRVPDGAPDPTNHWGIIVGEFYHELNCDGDLNVVYQNGKLKETEWQYYHVGETKYNDEMIRVQGEEVISRMRNIDPHYHVLDNNCQLFTLNLATQICTDAIPNLYTSWRNDVWEQKAKGEVATRVAEVMNQKTN